MWKRPKRGDTEDDIFKEQQLFLARKQRENEFKPAATVFSRDCCSDEQAWNTNTDNTDKCENSFNFDLKIVERNVSHSFRRKFQKGTAKGFPGVSEIDCKNAFESETKTCSIFLQQMKKKAARSNRKTMELNSRLIDGSGLKGFTDVEKELQLIHEENLNRLKSMTPDEINEARNQLINELNPKLIDFLKKKNTSSSLKGEENMDIDVNCDDCKVVDVTTETEDISHIPITIDEVLKNKWLNMNVVEHKKLDWMKPVSEKSDEVNISARFNFEGKLIETNEPHPINSGLYNHGDEPERAGYSLNELIDFVRSSLPSQKILGLQTLGNVMERVHKGYYDSIFLNSIQEELLSNTDILLIVRKCLDETSDTILAASIHCLHGLICNTIIDELYLDRIFSAPISNVSLSTPHLIPVLNNDANIEEYTDSQLVREDAILGLLRTDILPRIRYLIDYYLKRQNDKLITEKLFDLLIRIARHSEKSSIAILDCNYLIETIVEHYLPATVYFDERNMVGNPSAKALKLLRVIVSSGVHIPRKLFASFPQLWQSLQIYISIDPFTLGNNSKFSSTDLLKVSVETLRLWSVLMSQPDQEEISQKFEELFPLIIRQLQFCFNLNLSHRETFDWQYASTLLCCLASSKCSPDIHGGLSLVVKTVTFQWVRELLNNNLIPNVDVIMCIAAGIDYLFKQCYYDDLIENFLKPFLRNCVVTEKFFLNLLNCSSVIFCNKSKTARLRRDAKCLPSLHFVYFAGEEMKLNLLFGEESVFSLFVVLVTVLEKAESSLIEKVVMNRILVQYIDCVSTNFVAHEFNYLECMEINALATLINCNLSATRFRATNYHSLALNILWCVKNKNLQEKLVEIVFNRPIYDHYLDARISLMGIDDSANIAKGSLEFLPHIKEIYLQSTTFKTPLWIYDPILHSFNSGNSDASVVTRVLQYFVVLANYNESYLMNICSLSVHFVEIATVFLLNNDVFFEEEVQHCLLLLLKKLLALNITFKSSSESVPHTSTFINFFDLFVNHFEFASYGNVLFANYLLVFLQQNCDKTFKKKLLTENAYALRAIFIPLNELCLNIEKLLFPVETDAEIIELLLRCLLSRTVTPEMNKLIYLIGIHHIHHSLIRNADNLMETQPKTYRKLIRSVEMTTNDRLKEHIMHYSHHDFSESLGFVCK